MCLRPGAPDPLTGFKGPTSKGEGRAGERKGKERGGKGKGQGRGGERRGREGKGERRGKGRERGEGKGRTKDHTGTSSATSNPAVKLLSIFLLKNLVVHKLCLIGSRVGVIP